MEHDMSKSLQWFVKTSIIIFYLFSFLPVQPALALPEKKPLLVSTPAVSLSVPSAAFIGDTVTLTVTFDNPDPADPGYGPLIDLIIPTNGADGAQNTNPPLDGLTFVNAAYLGSNVENTVLTFPGSGGVACVNHPYMVDSSGSPVQVCGNAGDTFVALRLPFGSFTADQPPLTVDVTLSMSNLADLGVPLTIQARGGYQFGYTPLNDYCCGDDPSLTLSGWTTGSVTPALFTLSKTYSGPEDETATGPNFPRQYTVTAEIAPGQTMTSFNLTDIMPDNMQFVSLVNTAPGGASCAHTNPAAPGGSLTCNFTSVSGTVSMTFEYYIPLRDAGSASVIDPSTGNDALSCNNASGGGSWTPIDGRDIGGTFTQDPSGCEHTLTPKSIATQKNVSVVGGGQPAPGRTLEYAIDIQISDFFAFDQIVLTDTISDGQRWDATFAPTLQIVGNPVSLASSGAFNAANYTVSPNYTPADPVPNDGSTAITFRISDEMILRSGDGRLIGGCVPPGGAPGDPNCDVGSGGYNDGPTTARVIFRTVIQEEFSDNFPSGDSSVDQGDVLINTESVNGRILSTTDAVTPTGFAEGDDSSAAATIERGTLTKDVYAVNGVTPPPSPVRIAAGDTVTFRLTYALVTSDFEDLFLTDYLPLPIFDSTEITTHSNTVCGVPAAGTSCLGPGDTYHSLPAAISPNVSSDGVSNWVRWAYGDYDSSSNTASTIDILFTVTVENDPFADNLHLTNQAYVTEGSTNGTPGEAASIVEITYTSPVMTTTKSVVATDNPAPAFTPSLPVAFTAPGSAPVRWAGTINSNLLDATPIDSDVSGLDAGDLVTFAIFLVNEGTGINGAFDIVIQDTFDALGFEYPSAGDPNSINLQIYYGDGSGPISYQLPGGGAAGPGDLFSTGIELVDPVGQGVCSAHDPNLGNNVIVITYDLRMRSDIAPGTYVNSASLLNYSGSEGGPNFLPQPQTDDADVATDEPLLAKTLAGTEFNTPQNSNTQAVIGEFVTYTLTLTAPEGVLPSVQIVDTLDAGLAFVDLQSVIVSNPDTDGAGAGDDGIYSSATTFDAGGNCTNCTAGTGGGSNPLISASGGQDGRQIVFNFGNLVNTNTDNTVSETITITYRAVVLNVTGNQSGGQRNNAAALTWTGGSLPSVSAPNVTIIEPVVNTAKSVLPATADAGDTVTFTVTLTNPAASSTTAYDVTWSDAVPAGLTYIPGTLAMGACTASTPLTLSDAGAPTLAGSGGLFQPGESCTLTFQATVDYTAAPGQTITNTAITRWTSLSGSVSDRSTFNIDSDERTGADGVGGALNDYASQGQAGVAISSVAPQKYLLATSELHSGVVSSTARVVVGEIVRYRLVVQLPEGTSANFQIDDNLPGGLTYLDGTAKAAFVSNGAGITSGNVGALPVPGITDSDCFLPGSTADGTTPAIPAACSALADNNVGSTNSTSTDTDTYGNSTDPQFKLGTLTNNDSDADAEYVILEFNALINNASAGSNDAGDNRSNDFGVSVNGTANGSLSNSVTVRIAEPSLSLAKAITTAPSDAGDTVTYILTIASASGNDRATAFDLSLTDAFDFSLTGLTVSSVTSTQGATCTGNGAGTTTFSHNGGSFTLNTLTFTATCLDPGQSITVTVTGTVSASAPAGYTIPNTANLTYTSLPGTNGTTSNPTGSAAPGASGTDTGERNGSDGVGGAVDDYAAVSSANTTLTAPQMDKLTPSPAQYAIGEQVTFNILVTLPEGVTPALQVVDDLPLGLEYVSHQVVTTAAASGGLLAADYNGTLPAPTVTAPGGSGGDLTLAFGDTTTAADNAVNNNAFIARVVARVLNEAGSQNGASLTNTAAVSWTGGSASDSVNIAVIEPELDIQKTADDSNWVYGQTVTFTVTVSHLGSSTANAYDLTIADTIPAGLTYVSGSIAASGGCSANDSGAPNLTWTCATLPLGSTATLTYQVTVNSPPTPPFLAGNDTALNTASLNWSSLTGSSANERNGSGGINDYTDSGSHTGSLEGYYAFGNRVWFDTNNNTQFDAGEAGVDGVTVNLYAADASGNPTGPILAADTTSGGGYYHFDYLIPGDYVVVLPASNFASGGALEGYWSSQTTRADNGSIGETTAPDPDTDTDSDDNGTLQPSGAFNGAVISQAVTLGASSEPLNESDLESGVNQGAQPDNRANMTVDFGFYRVEAGNLIFRDDVTDGVFVFGDDTPLDGVTVELLSGDGLTILDTTTTSGGGLYSFSGQSAGNYVVRVTTPSGMVSTTDAFDSADNADADVNTDDNDNGIGTGVGTAVSVSSSQVTLTPGSTGAQNNNTVTNANGTTSNPAVDFGFVYSYALGNRVWFDTDNDSRIDFGTEAGVDGVAVELYAADAGGSPIGAVLATEITANGGYYLFDNLYPGDYVVIIPASNFASGGALQGYWSSATSIQSNGAITETTAPDPDNDTDSDDNGTLQTSGAFSGAVISQAVALGPNGLSEPLNESDLESGVGQGVQPDGRANMTVDFGFYRVEAGNLVFSDLDQNGAFNGADTPLANIQVRLYAADGTTEINVGLDGILGTPDDAAGGMFTNASGLYLFSGLPEGSYIASVTGPAGSSSAIDTFDSADSANPAANTDDNDNGLGVASGTVSSAAVALTPGSAGAQNNNTVANSSGTTTNPTVDFGFVPTLYSLGNRVWFDTDNNGQIDAGEAGVDGVLVELFAADLAGNPISPALAAETTANGGYYLFDNLAAGDYIVVVSASNLGGVLSGYWSSATTIAPDGTISESAAPDPDGAPDVDSDDNGELNLFGALPGAAASRVVTLGPGNSEPTGESDLESGIGQGLQPDVRANVTVDFGFYRQQLGSLVFVDVNGNGTYDAGDTLLAGATVQLFAGNGTTEINVGPDGIFGTADDAPGGVTTSASGAYLFSGLPEGEYTVLVTPPVGYTSTVDTADSADTSNPNTNTDNNDNGVGGGVGQVFSNTVTLTPGSPGAQNNNTVTNASGTTTNPTVDFGFIANNGAISKTLTGTNETFTSGNDAAIGEILTYEVLVNLPVGTPLDNVTITDRLDKGLAFVDCTLVELAGTDITNTVCPPAVSSITDSGDSPANPANPGRQMVFTVGSIPAQTSAATLRIVYRAIVLDVIENQDGVELNNSVTFAFTGGSFSTSAPNAEIVEPDLAIDKSAIPTDGVPAGTPIQFTLTISHTQLSSADAFDVVVTDILPPELEYIPCTVVYSGLAPTTPPAPAYCPGATNNLVFQWDVFPLGATATITFNARLVGSPATNASSVAWTSLPIDPAGGLPVQLSTHNSTSTERWYDPLDDVNVYSVSDSVTINDPAGGGGSDDDEEETGNLPKELPDSGFTPNVITRLPAQPAEKAYTSTEVWLEIPSLSVRIPVVGVPVTDDNWDVTWLWRQAGWLEGTAFPGWNGNSVLTGHVVLPNGSAGPFAALESLKWGDRVIVRAYGTMYIYEVRQNRIVSPYNTTVLQHEEDAWLTLLTCKDYNETADTYAKRIAVRAVLVKVQADTSADQSGTMR
ncbi:MAG: hypothetical protein DPW18_17030 [Chloroflexi bacterium]|nr:hypothetical protein [Chloroflexota bacterium]MDL1942987.1 sortase [Chloroflexi bacterium CFX2]